MATRFFIAGLIFISVAVCGLKVAGQKLLWNDELFTQVETIDRLGFPEIIQAKFPEGNLSPLFYLGQKWICALADYRLPVKWRGEFCIYEPHGQVLLRILPVVCMALAMALIFWYFAVRFSFGTGFLSLAVTLSGFSFWAFMPEARPYALWVLLCALQCMLFWEIVGGQNAGKRWPWLGLALVNILLAFTIFFSAFSVIAVAVVLFCYQRRQYLWYSFLVTVLPLAICAMYYFLAKRTYANLAQDPGSILLLIKSGLALVLSGALFAQRDLILTNVSPFWFYFLAVGAGVIGWRYVAGRSASCHCSLEEKGFWGLLGAFVLMLAMALTVIFWFLGWKASGNFAVAERYFIFLTPFAVFLVVLTARLLWRRAQEDAGCRLMVVVGTGSVIALTSLWTHIQLMKWGPFWSV
ncbi:MAG: hypothetical protein HQL20_04040 [Candidatus Omnitrophica bacterium]|nr:hypothetical protein [Candidatus Omnitrophota bacterium]